MKSTKTDTPQIIIPSDPRHITILPFSSSNSEVIDQLKDEGFTLVNSDEKLTEKQFAVDPLCTDVLIFPGEYREDLVEHDLFIGGKIVIQVHVWSLYI